MTNNNYTDDIFSDELVDLDKDAFNFDSEAEKLAQQLKRGKAPFVAAICGEWGAGKSSFLRFLHKKLKDKDNIVIYFNAWRASLHETPEISFIHELTTQLKISNIFQKESKKLKEVCNALISSSIDVFSENSKTWGLLLKTYKKTKEKLKNQIEETIKSENKLLTSFEKLCALIPEGKNIYVFIDELDRCSPEKTVKIVESLKKYFYGKDILYEEIIVKKNEKGNGKLVEFLKYIKKYIAFEIITPLFYSTNQNLEKRKRNRISSTPFKYILAIDEEYVSKAFATHYKLNKSDAIKYISKFIQFKYRIQDNDWTKYIKNIISDEKIHIDNDFWSDEHIKDVNHILINAFLVYNPRSIKKIVQKIIIHQSSYPYTFKERRDHLKNAFNYNIDEPKVTTEKLVLEERILRATNVFWIIDSCIQELYQSEIEWYKKYNVFEKLPNTTNKISGAKTDAKGNLIDWSIPFFFHNYKIPVLELQPENGKIRKNTDLMAFSINQAIIYIMEIIKGIKIKDFVYNPESPHEYYPQLFKHLIKNEWDQINNTLFKR